MSLLGRLSGQGRSENSVAVHSRKFVYHYKISHSHLLNHTNNIQTQFSQSIFIIHSNQWFMLIKNFLWQTKLANVTMNPEKITMIDLNSFIINWLIEGDIDRGQSKICKMRYIIAHDTILRNYTFHATLIMTVQQI